VTGRIIRLEATGILPNRRSFEENSLFRIAV
jgi:hypothetical protein